MKCLRLTTIALYITTIVVMAAATIIEKMMGTPYATTNIYGSWWFAALWTLLAIAGIAYILRVKLINRPFQFLMHSAFVTILVGAIVTHMFGQQGTMHLRVGESSSIMILSNNSKVEKLPFALTLNGFKIENYPGTQSAMDYVSQLSFSNGKQSIDASVSMNKIAEFKSYRFYQSGYDPDHCGTYLSVSHDPIGIGITYVGYALLFISMLLLLILPNESFRKLLRTMANGKVLVLTTMLTLGCFSAHAYPSKLPPTLPQNVAHQFGELYAYSNGRICPVQTVARNFTLKLYGKTTYKGLTAEQVLCGWIFYPSQWANEPMIKLKGNARNLVGCNRYASYNDFFGTKGYKLEDAMQAILNGDKIEGAKTVREADEKLNIVQMLLSRQMLKIYPSVSNGKLVWYSQGDNLPIDQADDKWIFIKKSMDYLGELVFNNDTETLCLTIGKIRDYQEKEAANLLPSDARIKAERLFNALSFIKLLAMILATLGIIMFVFCMLRMANQTNLPQWIRYVSVTLLAMCTIYLALMISLRGFIGQHLPLSSGSETMQFMALCTLAFTLLLNKRFVLMLPFGFLMSGLSLMVASFSESSPQITHLMPVLASPLLSIHVCVLMIAYSLLAFMMLNGVAAIVLGKRNVESMEKLLSISKLMLYPALFLLTAGIFIGAIWANQSWGRYWGWDPKEVWALITMMIYAMPMHQSMFPKLQKPYGAHIFNILAFLAVLITYFGVNMLLGGMHSYANA